MCSRKVFQEKKLYNPNQLKFCSSISLNEKRIERPRSLMKGVRKDSLEASMKRGLKVVRTPERKFAHIRELNEKRIERKVELSTAAAEKLPDSMKRGLKAFI